MLLILHPKYLSAKPKAEPRIKVKELKLPEVIIKGKDVTLLSDTKKFLLPKLAVSTLKQAPEIALKDEIKKTQTAGEKISPEETEPGCMYSNSCASVFSKATKGDEGYYKAAVAGYLRGEYDTAYELFSSLVEKYPKGGYAADAYYWLAEINLNQYGRPEDAKKFYNILVKEYPSARLMDYAYYSLAFMHFNEGDFELAKKFADAAFDSKPAGKVGEKSLMMSLLSAYFLKDYEECLEKCGKYLKTFSQTKHVPVLTYIKGNIFYFLEQYDKAKKEFTHFLGNYKGNEYAVYNLYGLGLTNIKLGLVKDSVPQNEEIVEKYPDFKYIDAVMLELIKAYCLENKLDMATSMLKKLEEKAPKSAYIENGHYEIAYSYFISGSYEEASTRFLIALEKYPLSILKGAEYFMLAGAEIKLKKYADALDHYNVFLGMNGSDDLVKEAMLNSAYAYYLDGLPKETTYALKDIISKYGPAFEKINEVWYFSGESYYKMKAFNMAESSFSKVEPESEYYNLAVLGLGWLRFEGMDYTEAIEYFLKYLDSGAEEFLPETYLVLAESYFNIKDYDNAMENLKKIVRSFPDSGVMGKVDYLMGLINFKKGDFKMAVMLLGSALDDHKDAEYADDTKYWLGWSYFQLGEYDNAAKEFTNLVSEFPNSPFAPKAILKIGDCYYNLKRYTSATVSYKSIIKKSPGTAAAAVAEYGIIQTFYSQEDYDEFAVRSKEFIKKYPENELGAIILLQLAEHYSDEDKSNEAALVYKDMAKMYPKSDLADDALYKSGRILYKARDNEEALKNFLTVLKKYPDSNLMNENNYYLANTYFALGKYQSAIKYYGLTTENMADTDIAKESFKKASDAYIRLNNYKKAAKELINAAKMFDEDPFNKRTYIKVGDIFFDNNDYDIAISYYKKSLDSTYQGVGVNAQMKIADSYYAMSDFETALLEYLKIIYLHKSEKEFVDDAYFKIGGLYVMLGKKEEAKKIYLRLQNESLDPDKIGVAIKKLKELGVDNE
jgi:TolA-binding protein